MAASVFQSRKTYFSSTSGNLAFSSAVATGSLLVVCISSYGVDDGTLSVSDSVNGAYGRKYYTIGGDGSLEIALYFKYNSGAGTPTVTVSNTSSAYVSFTIIECRGVQTSPDPSDGSDTNTATSVNVSGGPITPTVLGDILIANMTSMAASQVTINPDGDYTELQEYENGETEVPMNVMYRIYNSTSPDTANWTMGSSYGNIGGVAAFKEAPTLVFSMPPANINVRNSHLFVR